VNPISSLPAQPAPPFGVEQLPFKHADSIYPDPRNAIRALIGVIEATQTQRRDSDVPEVIMKRKQQDARAKAAKHCSTCTEKRQQEAQTMAAKHQSESLRSTRSAVSTRYNQTFVCSCVFIFKCLRYTL